MNKQSTHTFMIWVWGTFVLATSILTGCGALPSGPQGTTHTFTLTQPMSDQPQSIQSNREKESVLLVNLPRAQSGFNTQRMAYVSRDHEVSYFAFHQWAQTPAHMLLPLLVNALEKTGQWKAVVHMPSPVRGDFQLISENLLLQQEFTQEPSRIRTHLRVQLIRLQDFQVISTREFTVLENAKSEDPYGGVQAANVATKKLVGHISEWLSLCVQKPLGNQC